MATNVDVSNRYANKLFVLLDMYSAEVNASPLSDASKKDYIMFAEQFVRWVDGSFTPGANVK